MNIFVIGAHRTGKSTLAKEIAKRKNMEYFPINLKDCNVWNDYDYSNLENISFKTKIIIQQNLLDYYLEQIKGKDNCVFDRSIFDIYAYTLLLEPKSLDDIIAVENLEQNLIYNIDTYSKYILVQPGIKINENASVFYSEYKQFQLNYIFVGLLYTYLLSKKFITLTSEHLDHRIKDSLNFLA